MHGKTRMQVNGENCADNTDNTDADERRELYGLHGKTRMQMNRDSVTLRENPCSSKNIRSIRSIR